VAAAAVAASSVAVCAEAAVEAAAVAAAVAAGPAAAAAIQTPVATVELMPENLYATGSAVGEDAVTVAATADLVVRPVVRLWF